MTATRKHADRLLLLLVGVLVAYGVLTFVSGAFGLLARGETHITSVAFTHIVFGVGLGLLALFITSRIDYRLWRHWALLLFLLAAGVSALVFVPIFSLEHAGGTRWLDLGFFSFQPSETMKIGAVLLAAAYFSVNQKRIDSLRYGLGAFLAILTLPAIILLLQPDVGTLGIIVIAVGAVYVAAGARISHLFLIGLLGALLIGTLAFTRPYVKDRITTFLNPAQNPQAEGYQIRQSLIAVGSGGFSGRGFGQGLQKFTYLPEPMGDSVFAVAAEEFGFVGGVSIITLFLLLVLRGFSISIRASDSFGTLLGVGIVSYLTAEALINIAAMLGLVPLTGIPLTFFSQGGSAMLISLGSVGILLSISKRTSHT